MGIQQGSTKGQTSRFSAEYKYFLSLLRGMEEERGKETRRPSGLVSHGGEPPSKYLAMFDGHINDRSNHSEEHNEETQEVRAYSRMDERSGWLNGCDVAVKFLRLV